MAKLPAPTKANLFRSQKELRFAVEGAELLHQKRDVLVMELMNILSDFGDSELKLREQMIAALNSFVPVRAAMGRDLLDNILIAGQPEMSLGIQGRAVMGIALPAVRLASGGKPAMRGPVGTPSQADAATAAVGDVVPRLLRFVEIVATIWRLATEIEKTQRRINAIENVFIPDARRIIFWIKSAMEENDREELFRRKLLKSRTR